MAAIVLGAAVLRLADLDNRPMHCDEAVHAEKFRLLLEHQDYTYNPYEFHGPSLNFLTLPIARLAGATQLTQITETNLRLLPAIAGIVLVGLVWVVREELGRGAALWAALLTAVSPAMVFFSRYYIQEMLLVCFTFGAIVALWRYARTLRPGPDAQCPGRRLRLRQVWWLVLLGVCIGMMHASKETCVIALVAMAVAAALTIRCGPQKAASSADQPQTPPGKGRRWLLAGVRQLRRIALPAAIVLVCAAGVSALLFSSLLRNPRGVVDSLTAYFYYLGRASGEGSAGRHVYAWYYYFELLFWHRRGTGPLWSEGSIAVLALVGLLAAALGKGLPRANLPLARFLGIYTVLMTAVYSAMPYKTPWCALGLLHGMILLAGIGAAVLIRIVPGYALKTAAFVLLVAAAGHLAWQAWRASFVAYEDPGNPYVYSQTTGDVPLLARRVREIAALHRDGQDMHIQVICPQDDHWPLPWYLRGLRRVDWFPGIPRGRAAPLIITQPEMEPALAEYLYRAQPEGQRHLYVPLPSEHKDADWYLRPHVPLRVYVRLDLWEAYLASKESGAGDQGPGTTD